MRRNDTTNLIAVYHIAMAIPLFVASAVLAVLLVPAVLAESPSAAVWSVFAISVGLFLTLFLGLVYAIVGIGVWRLWPWARWGAIVLAIIVLPAFPVWTVIGLLIIFYLLQDSARRAFRD
jgi:hypothetical protein